MDDIYGNITQDQYELMDAIKINSIEDVIRIVKEKRVDPNFETSNLAENSPIYLAVFSGKLEIMRWLLDKGGVKPTRKLLEWAGIVGNPTICHNILERLNSST